MRDDIRYVKGYMHIYMQKYALNGDLRRNWQYTNGDLSGNWVYMNGDLRYIMIKTVFIRKIYDEILEYSEGEFRSVCKGVGGINAMINIDCKDKDALATLGYAPEIWKGWV